LTLENVDPRLADILQNFQCLPNRKGKKYKLQLSSILQWIHILITYTHSFNYIYTNTFIRRHSPRSLSNFSSLVSSGGEPRIELGSYSKPTRYQLSYAAPGIRIYKFWGKPRIFTQLSQQYKEDEFCKDLQKIFPSREAVSERVWCRKGTSQKIIKGEPIFLWFFCY